MITTPRPVRSHREMILIGIGIACVVATAIMAGWWYRLQQQRNALVAQTDDRTLVVTDQMPVATTAATPKKAVSTEVLQHETLRVLRYYAPAVTLVGSVQGNDTPFRLPGQ